MASLVVFFALIVSLPIVSYLSISAQSSASATLITSIKNSCGQETYVAMATPGSPSGTRFKLRSGEIMDFEAAPNTSLRIWAMTECGHNAAGRFLCATGNSGSSSVECPNGTPPPHAATLVYFSPCGAAANCFSYGVTLDAGYNLPVTVVPRVGAGPHCTTTGCVADVNEHCPRALRVVNKGVVVGCKSASQVCTGNSSSGVYNRRTKYSDYLRKHCPRANITFTCFATRFTSTATRSTRTATVIDVEFCASSVPTPPPGTNFSRRKSPKDAKGSNMLRNILLVVAPVVISVAGTTLWWVKKSGEGASQDPSTCVFTANCLNFHNSCIRGSSKD